MLVEIVKDFSKDIELTPEVMLARRNRLLSLEKQIIAHPDSIGMDEYNPGNILHHFSDGVYGRELFMKAGVMVMSKIHRRKTFNVIAQGLVMVLSEEGVMRYKGPIAFVSKPMTKRFVMVEEDTVWITSHAVSSDTQDLDEIEKEVIAPDFSELQGGTV